MSIKLFDSNTWLWLFVLIEVIIILLLFGFFTHSVFTDKRELANAISAYNQNKTAEASERIDDIHNHINTENRICEAALICFLIINSLVIYRLVARRMKKEALGEGKGFQANSMENKNNLK